MAQAVNSYPKIPAVLGSVDACICGLERFRGEKCMKKFLLASLLLVALFSLLASTSTVRADSSHQVVGKTSPSNTFATTDHGCLGPLRSQIAQGQFNGVGPFGEHF